MAEGHTLGPWTWIEPPHPDDGSLALHREVLAAPNGGVVMRTTYDDSSIEFNSEADARLIAAAPELLEALEHLVENGTTPHPLSGRDPTVRAEDIPPALAAIVKW